MRTLSPGTTRVWPCPPLGHPIPNSPHAVSVSLPRWQDVIGYEEKAPEVMSQLRTGYPRFVIHPAVQQLGRELGQGQPCLPFPSEATARLCAEFVSQSTGAPARVLSRQPLHAVLTTDGGAPALRAFWQHTGLIVSSRQAEAFLAGQPENPDAAAIRRALRQQLAGLYDCGEQDVFLTPSGMAALWTALRVVQRQSPGRPTLQLGFPYVDTLKLQQKLGHGGHLAHELDRVEHDLERLLRQQRFAAAFCEIPGNPLLGSVNLRRVTPILRDWAVPLVIDDVVATPLNVDLRPFADLIATSLTKFFVGTADAMGGAVICNPRSPYSEPFRARLQAEHEDLLWAADGQVLLEGGRTFAERMRQHNANGLLVAEYLHRHPAVERVWYPRWTCAEAYEAVRRADGGWGALITFLPRQAETRAARIYDTLKLCKGPSLGTVFSLACPFTLLAHYTELDWAESCGASRYLIRLSVGLENVHDIMADLEQAFEASEASPTTNQASRRSVESTQKPERSINEPTTR